MERKPRRAAQAMYVPPGRRALNSVTQPVQKKHNGTERTLRDTDGIGKLIDSFSELNMHDGKKVDELIKHTKTIVQGINGQSKNETIEKLVVMLMKEGNTLHTSCPNGLDSLMDLIRDKILETQVKPSTKRYLFNIIEWRARSFRLV